MTRELRIYGPPGTGKTTFLRRKVEATVRQRGRDSIRIASLTRAAAAEIGSRVDLPREAVGTLHAHAFRALGRPALAETPEGMDAWNQRAHKLGEAYVMPKRQRAIELDDAGGEALVPATEGEGLLQQYGMLRARCTPRELWPPAVISFAEIWEEWKREADRLDFNDLIERAIDDVPVAPGIPSVFLLDEAQDMSRLDMRLARQWGERCEVFVVVGDPDQNLYQWRGSEPEAFTGVKAADTTVLERSYRVPAAVHRYATRWLEQTLPTRSEAAYKPRLLEDGSEAAGAVRHVMHTYREPEALVRELEERREAGERVMVLAACGFHLEPVLAILRRRGVPFGNPYRLNDGRLNPLAGSSRISSFLTVQPKEAGGKNHDWTWNDVRRFTEPLKASATLERGAKAFIEAKCAKAGLLDEEDPGEQFADADTTLGLFLEGEAREAVERGDLEWYERNLLASKTSSLAYSLNVARKYGGQALQEQPTAQGGAGIIVGTIHSVKGGEADVVYVFPDLSRAGFEGWLMRGPRHDAVSRQFYVAFTRAREELVLCEPSGSNAVQFPAVEREESR